MIRALALYQNGRYTFNLYRVSFDLPSREEVGHSAQEPPRSRSDSKGCLNFRWSCGTERYAARAKKTRVQACLLLFTETLGRLAANYTLCVDANDAPPFFFITDWYGSWQLLLNDERPTVTQDYSTRIWRSAPNVNSVQSQRTLEAQRVLRLSACPCPYQGPSTLLLYVSLIHI